MHTKMNKLNKKGLNINDYFLTWGRQSLKSFNALNNAQRKKNIKTLLSTTMTENHHDLSLCIVLTEVFCKTLLLIFRIIIFSTLICYEASEYYIFYNRFIDKLWYSKCQNCVRFQQPIPDGHFKYKWNFFYHDTFTNDL